MANPNRVGSNTQDNFGNYRIANADAVSLGTAANAVITLPVLGGGTGGTTQYIIRRITVSNLTNSAGGTAPSAATANVSVGTTNDGANLVASVTKLTNLTAGSRFVDLTLDANAASNVYTANALYLNVQTAVANAAVSIKVYADVGPF